MGIHSVGTSDAALVRRVHAGDTGAYADLVARYRDRLGRYALHMLGNREDAEEVLQDSFVRAYRSLARCDDPERFGAWLRSEEHTSELQSHLNLVCRLLLEKKKKKKK